MTNQDDYDRWAANLLASDKATSGFTLGERGEEFMRPASWLGQFVAWSVAVGGSYAYWLLLSEYSRHFNHYEWTYKRGDMGIRMLIVLVATLITVLVLWWIRRLLIEGALNAAALVLRASRRVRSIGDEVKRRADG